ncbi:MAG: hypothetical protein LBI05_01655 [Planctomycetaceae bacterium]|jgi:hypothetical protein|nr:hypothetical protein [Planctomycetaceae bacterium]
MLNLIPKNSRLCNNTYIVNVTPSMARLWLDFNNFNRPKNTETVDKYVRQIRDGRWRLTHQGIAFTADGVLLDGQHRLFAIIECGFTLPMRVCLNEPAENFAVIDCGRNRSNLDVVRMSAKDSTLSTAHTQTLHSMLAGRLCKTANRWTNAETNELYETHKVAVNFAVDQFRGCKDKQINDRTVKGVIARAFYHVPQETLAVFCSLLTSSNDHHCRAAVDAFVWCLTYFGNRQDNTKREIYRRCELTLETFMNNSADVSFDKSITELFPLPNECR